MPPRMVLPDADALAAVAAERIVAVAREAIAARGRFMIALAGGATPRATYARLAATPEAVDWPRTWVAFGDERCVPPDHRESNYRAAREVLLDRVPVPSAQVMRMEGERPDPEVAATDYARRLAQAFGTRRGEWPRFDLVLLGMGLDGHTASLFPGSPAARETFRTVIAVHAAAAAIPQRLTLTLPVVNAARCVIMLVAGQEKARTVAAALAPGSTLPAGLVAPVDGELVWMLDRGAAARLPHGAAVR